MASFPAHTPEAREYTLGQIPQEEFRGEGNVPIQFQTGSIPIGQRLTLPYLNRPLAVVEAIWDHYRTQQRTPFTLPPEVWCGHAAGATIADPALRWRYVDATQPERVSVGIYSISVTLEAAGVTIPPTAENFTLGEAQAAAIAATQVPAMPARPLPLPDPPVEDAIITITPPTNTALPPLIIEFAAPAELRFATHGFLDSFVIEFAAPADLSQTP